MVTAMQLQYQAGNEHSPFDTFGRFVLELGSDGTVRVTHHRRVGPLQRWTATAGAGVLDRVLAALARAGFPAQPQVSPPLPDTTIRSLTVTGGPTGGVLLPWDAVAGLPGYAEAFELLDGLVVQLSGLEIPAAAPSDPAVTGIRRLE
jgi:hypothetical protein